MINILINDETSPLQSVVLGAGESFGGVPDISEAYDPKSREHILAGTYPKEQDIIREMNSVEKVLIRYGVKVYRPTVLQDTHQVFARDIGFVVRDKFIVPNIIPDRQKEQQGIRTIIEQLDPKQVVQMPEGAYAEGGDVMPWKGKLYIGYSEEEDYCTYKVSRTNRAGVDFLKSQFPDDEVFGLELKKSDTDPRENALHLDCCFQPIGHDQCILYKGGFKYEKDFDLLVGHFGEANCIFIDQEEMYLMNSNIFSISPEVIISEQGFTRLNRELEHRGFTVETVPYSEIAKMEGLLRCSTLPLERAS